MPHSIAAAVAALGDGPLDQAGLVEHLFPLFSEVLERDQKEIYLANHSLGRPLDRSRADVEEGITLWSRLLDEAWGPWFGEVERFRAGTAALTGAPRADCIVPKSSAGQGVRAVLNSFVEPPRVLTTTAEFDSLDVILKQYAARQRAEVDWVGPGEEGRIAVDDLIARLEGIDLVVVSQVFFADGQVLDGVERLVAAAHAAGARVLLDVYHGYGVLPLDLSRLDVDFAVAGSYKYLRGGPGCCWLYVAPRWLSNGLSTLDTGWFAKRDPFSYQRPMPPQFAEGGDGWLESTFAPLPFFQARAGLELVQALGVARLRDYSLRQKSLLSAELSRLGIEHFGAGADYGAFLTVRHPEPMQLAERLKAVGVNADARAAGLRLCPDLLNSEAQLRQAAERLAGVL
ncbi:aminotransferase class V-fold PLP-dependent enzyme [Chitinimonas lacunae]|uniref:Aminotransferase class V-fold PLP-dependent enzyme n=1 Tax=Chitinimonas lacunae TaxID=1963018 RepID=A0ABV8MQI4_9NEIS